MVKVYDFTKKSLLEDLKLIALGGLGLTMQEGVWGRRQPPPGSLNLLELKIQTDLS